MVEDRDTLTTECFLLESDVILASIRFCLQQWMVANAACCSILVCRLCETYLIRCRDVKRLSVYRLSFIFLVLVFEFQKSIIVSNLGLSS